MYVVNLPGRTDKLDAMRLTAALTEFNFEIINGVKGDEIAAKAVPGVSHGRAQSSYNYPLTMPLGFQRVKRKACNYRMLACPYELCTYVSPASNRAL